jgi:hypothetical protein
MVGQLGETPGLSLQAQEHICGEEEVHPLRPDNLVMSCLCPLSIESARFEHLLSCERLLVQAENLQCV